MDNNMLVILIGLLSLGLGYFTYFLSKYTEKVNIQLKNIKNEGERTLFENALKDLHDTVEKTVVYTEQVVVKGLKEKSLDGKLSKEDILEIGGSVFKQVLDQISPEAKSVLQKNIVNLEDYVSKTVETNVFNLKK